MAGLFLLVRNSCKKVVMNKSLFTLSTAAGVIVHGTICTEISIFLVLDKEVNVGKILD